MEYLTLSNELNTIEIREIMELLPHRYPFLLVDRVTDYELGQSIKAYKNITFRCLRMPGYPSLIFAHRPRLSCGLQIFECGWSSHKMLATDRTSTP